MHYNQPYLNNYDNSRGARFIENGRQSLHSKRSNFPLDFTNFAKQCQLNPHSIEDSFRMKNYNCSKNNFLLNNFDKEPTHKSRDIRDNRDRNIKRMNSRQRFQDNQLEIFDKMMFQQNSNDFYQLKLLIFVSFQA